MKNIAIYTIPNRTITAGEYSRIDIENELHDLGFLVRWEKPVWVLVPVKEPQL